MERKDVRCFEKEKCKFFLKEFALAIDKEVGEGEAGELWDSLWVQFGKFMLKQDGWSLEVSYPIFDKS